jgi:hypothetical protein
MLTVGARGHAKRLGLAKVFPEILELLVAYCFQSFAIKEEVAVPVGGQAVEASGGAGCAGVDGSKGVGIRVKV